jgi:hypothetical protein
VPEATDLHQRGRAAEEILRHVLMPAGSGADLLGYGPLTDTVPAIWPRRLGRWRADAAPLAWSDRFTVLHVPWLAAQAPLATVLAPGADAVAIEAHPACGIDTHCGFRRDDKVLVTDGHGRFTLSRISGAGPGVLLLDQPATVGAEPPGLVAVADTTVIYFDAANRQLRRYDGFAADQPLIDDVVWAGARFYGDPLPPRRPALTARATCVVDGTGLPLLPLLGPVPAPLVELSLGQLSDGPWCGDPPLQYDADLLRVRAVRIALRLQAGAPTVRGVGVDFASPGTARRAGRQVRDLELDVLVTPRALAGGD